MYRGRIWDSRGERGSTKKGISTKLNRLFRVLEYGEFAHEKTVKMWTVTFFVAAFTDRATGYSKKALTTVGHLECSALIR